MVLLLSLFHDSFGLVIIVAIVLFGKKTYFLSCGAWPFFKRETNEKQSWKYIFWIFFQTRKNPEIVWNCSYEMCRGAWTFFHFSWKAPSAMQYLTVVRPCSCVLRKRDSSEVLIRTALRYEHDRFVTTIDSRWCDWRDENSKILGRIGGYLHHASIVLNWGRRCSNAMIFVLDSPEVLMMTALRYEHDRPATTIDSRRCEWRDQNSKNFRKNWGW